MRITKNAPTGTASRGKGSRNASPSAIRPPLRPRFLKSWFERFDAFWEARTPREQAILGGGSFVLLLVVGYTGLWEPAAREREALEKALPGLRANLTEMEMLAQEARSLSPSGAPSRRGDALTQALQESLGPHGLKATHLATTGDNTVQLRLEKVAFGSVASWLQDVRLQQRFKVTDARFQYVGAPALVNVTATLQGPGASGHN